MVLAFLLVIARRDFQGPALIEPALDVVLAFQSHDVFVHGGERCQAQPFRDFLIAGTVSLFVQESREEVQEFLLAFGEGHRSIVGEERGNVHRNTKMFPWIALATSPARSARPRRRRGRNSLSMRLRP